jgi:hypothetical protein
MCVVSGSAFVGQFADYKNTYGIMIQTRVAQLGEQITHYYQYESH